MLDFKTSIATHTVRGYPCRVDDGIPLPKPVLLALAENPSAEDFVVRYLYLSKQGLVKNPPLVERGASWEMPFPIDGLPPTEFPKLLFTRKDHDGWDWEVRGLVQKPDITLREIVDAVYPENSTVIKTHCPSKDRLLALARVDEYRPLAASFVDQFIKLFGHNTFLSNQKRICFWNATPRGESYQLKFHFISSSNLTEDMWLYVFREEQPELDLDENDDDIVFCKINRPTVNPVDITLSLEEIIQHFYPQFAATAVFCVLNHPMHEGLAQAVGALDVYGNLRRELALTQEVRVDQDTVGIREAQYEVDMAAGVVVGKNSQIPWRSTRSSYEWINGEWMPRAPMIRQQKGVAFFDLPQTPDPNTFYVLGRATDPSQWMENIHRYIPSEKKIVFLPLVGVPHEISPAHAMLYWKKDLGWVCQSLGGCINTAQPDEDITSLLGSLHVPRASYAPGNDGKGKAFVVQETILSLHPQVRITFI